MVELLDIHVWSVIFNYLEQDSKINLINSSKYFNSLRNYIHVFYTTNKNMNNIFNKYPNITSLICNGFSKDTDFSKLTKLTSLIYFTHYHGSTKPKIIYDFNKLTNLTFLDCRDCGHIGCIDKLINLISLNCIGCLNIKNIDSLKKLEQLDICDCQKTDVHIDELPNLTDYYCDFCDHGTGQRIQKSPFKCDDEK